MRNFNFLILGMLCLVLGAHNALGQDLQRRTSLRIEKAALTQVLWQLQEKEGLRFSYLNNELAGDTIRQFEMHDRPLGEILDKLLEGSGAGYKSHNGQLIIKKVVPQQQKNGEAQSQTVPAPGPGQNQAKAPSDEQAFQKQKQEKGIQQEEEKEKAASAANRQRTQAGEGNISTAKDTSAAKSAPTKPDFLLVKKNAPQAIASDSNYKVAEDITRPLSSPTAKKQAESRDIQETNPAGQESAKQTNSTKVDQAADTSASSASADWIRPGSDSSRIKPLHVGFVYPLSNHGLKAPEYVNRVSLHLLVGLAAGLEGIEYSGIGNIEKEYVKGLQFAGFFNHVNGPVDGFQFSGFYNISRGNLHGGQFAGFFNHAHAMKGGQYAGFMNLSREDVIGVQASGFLNIARDLDGAQVSGFMNLAKNTQGLQAGGFLSIADSLQGTQLAGFLNLAKSTEGFQASGFLNIADTVRGCQLGVFNMANAYEKGVPIGFMSFVRDGYKAFELYTAEDFQANLVFKTGVDRFYNILALGVETGGQERWGFGYGIGSQVISRRRFKLSTDLVSYQLVEGSYKDFPNQSFWQHLLDTPQTNQLHKLRVLGSLQVAKRLALFGGPTYNLIVSQYRQSPEGPIGSGLGINNAIYDRIHNNTNIKMWIGFNAGLRF